MSTGPYAIKSIIGLSIFSLSLQAMQTIAPQGDLVNQTSTLGITGLLALAVGVLWRALVKKDEVILAMTKTVTEALTTAVESNRELRHIIEEVRDEMHSGLPCGDVKKSK